MINLCHVKSADAAESADATLTAPCMRSQLMRLLLLTPRSYTPAVAVQVVHLNK